MDVETSLTCQLVWCSYYPSSNTTVVLSLVVFGITALLGTWLHSRTDT